MISQQQKLRLVNQGLQDSLQDGIVPTPEDLIRYAQRALGRRVLGQPLTQIRAAVPGYPVGGADGKDIQRTFTEMRADLDLLYESLLQITARGADIYQIFQTRSDQLLSRMRSLEVTLRTKLAQQAAGSRLSVCDSFQSLSLVDQERTTAFVDLAEGSVTLPANPAECLVYDGTRVVVVQAGGNGVEESGAAFDAVFSPYQTDAWYATLSEESTFTAVVNTTGADYDRGAADEVLINAVQIVPTGSLRVRIAWSPDGHNWHATAPAVDQVIDHRTTLHFTPVPCGYIRFQIQATDDSGIVGIRQIVLLKQGVYSSASLYSAAHRFAETIQSAVVEIDATIPVGSRMETYIAQSADGPWIPAETPVFLSGGQAALVEHVTRVNPEVANDPAALWIAGLPGNAAPLPGTGTLVAGRGQALISAYPFDWRAQGDQEHIPARADWNPALGVVRSGTFPPIDLDVDDDLTELGNPLSISDSGDYLVVTLRQGENWILQPGYCYRIAAAVHCLAPVTLQSQHIGVIYPGTSSAIAPVAVYLNGSSVFQKAYSVSSLENLESRDDYQTTFPFQEGWNLVEVLLQLPADLADRDLDAGNITLHIQPSLFSVTAESQGFSEVRAYRDPWKRVSEFDLRYNAPIGAAACWAWKLDSRGAASGILFNYDVSNCQDRNASNTTIDGQNWGYPVDLTLFYPGRLENPDATRELYFRADLFQDLDGAAPPVLHSYRIICN